MRTTLTLDRDVTVEIARLRETRKESLKTVVNAALRRGLRAMVEEQPARARVRTRAVNLGRCLAGSIDDVSETLARAEGERFR
jgi:hypothetical protein